MHSHKLQNPGKIVFGLYILLPLASFSHYPLINTWNLNPTALPTLPPSSYSGLSYRLRCNMSDSSSCANAARQLGDLLAQLPVGNVTDSWTKIEITAQNLANGLRIRDGEHFVLGPHRRVRSESWV